MLIRDLDVESLDAGLSRPAPARMTESFDRGGAAGKDRLDVAITAISHPTDDAERYGLLLGEGAEAHALHPTFDHDTHDGFVLAQRARALRAVRPA